MLVNGLPSFEVPGLGRETGITGGGIKNHTFLDFGSLKGFLVEFGTPGLMGFPVLFARVAVFFVLQVEFGTPRPD